MERAKKVLVSKQRHLMTMKHRRGGAYISNQVRMHACHLTSKHCTHIFICYKKILKKKTKKRKKREREKKIIELIIKENHCCDLGTERKMRRTLPLGNLKKNKKEKDQCECEGHRFCQF
jgi:hypothetical protein